MPVSSEGARAPSRKGAVPFIKIGFAQCRFIVSETTFPALCCGAPTDGGSWCDRHRQIVYEARRKPSPSEPARREG